MSSPEDPESRPSWMGAPGYVPHPEQRRGPGDPYGTGLPPHAPLPGAPPYPPNQEHPPPPVGQRSGRTSYVRALLASLVWAATLVVLVVAVSGPPPDPGSAGRLAGSVLVIVAVTSLVTWLVARRRGWPLWLLVLVAGPVFWLLRLIQSGAAS